MQEDYSTLIADICTFLESKSLTYGASDLLDSEPRVGPVDDLLKKSVGRFQDVTYGQLYAAGGKALISNYTAACGARGRTADVEPGTICVKVIQTLIGLLDKATVSLGGEDLSGSILETWSLHRLPAELSLYSSNAKQLISEIKYRKQFNTPSTHADAVGQRVGMLIKQCPTLSRITVGAPDLYGAALILARANGHSGQTMGYSDISNLESQIKDISEPRLTEWDSMSVAGRLQAAQADAIHNNTMLRSFTTAAAEPTKGGFDPAFAAQAAKLRFLPEPVL